MINHIKEIFDGEIIIIHPTNGESVTIVEAESGEAEKIVPAPAFESPADNLAEIAEAVARFYFQTWEDDFKEKAVCAVREIAEIEELPEEVKKDALRIIADEYGDGEEERARNLAYFLENFVDIEDAREEMKEEFALSESEAYTLPNDLEKAYAMAMEYAGGCRSIPDGIPSMYELMASGKYNVSRFAYYNGNLDEYETDEPGLGDSMEDYKEAFYPIIKLMPLKDGTMLAVLDARGTGIKGCYTLGELLIEE